MEHINIIAPELVFDEESGFGMRQSDEFAGVERRVERKVAHHIGPLIVFTHLVARG